MEVYIARKWVVRVYIKKALSDVTPLSHTCGGPHYLAMLGMWGAEFSDGGRRAGHGGSVGPFAVSKVCPCAAQSGEPGAADRAAASAQAVDLCGATMCRACVPVPRVPVGLPVVSYI